MYSACKFCSMCRFQAEDFHFEQESCYSCLLIPAWRKSGRASRISQILNCIRVMTPLALRSLPWLCSTKTRSDIFRFVETTPQMVLRFFVYMKLFSTEYCFSTPFHSAGKFLTKQIVFWKKFIKNRNSHEQQKQKFIILWSVWWKKLWVDLSSLN